MKNAILLLLFCLVAFCSYSQTTPVIDTAYDHAIAVKVTPVKAKFTDSLNVTHLSITVIREDVGGTSASFYIRLLDKDGNTLFERNFEASGNQYAAFVNNRMKAYTFIANKMGLTILSP
jgi:hypothetical protein